jgi:hypothetical protein
LPIFATLQLQIASPRKEMKMKQGKIILHLLCSVSLSFQLCAQSLVIEGNVIDAKAEQPLPFASVGVQNTWVGTATNSEGRFILTIPENLIDSILVISYMGYKSLKIPVMQAGSKITIKLDQDTFTLEEVEVNPWQPWDYIWNAMQKIPENYPNSPFMTQGYYTEYLSENGAFLKFTEGVVETYNPAYGDTAKSQSRVLKARRGKQLASLQFMREKIEKKQEKARRKALKKGEEVEEKESIDEQIISSSFGGPETILSADPLRDTASFLNPKYKQKYKYSIEGYSTYQNEQVIIIGYKSKGKYDHQRQAGKIYISLVSDAIISIEYNSKVIIPGIARPVIFFMGFGITNPEIFGKVHYKPIRGKWYISDISIEGGTKLTKKKMFKKNDRSQFYVEIALINNYFDLEKVTEIPEEQRIDTDKPLEEQVEPDPEFWQSYKVVRHSTQVEE